jgi:hypothetical protein
MCLNIYTTLTVLKQFYFLLYVHVIASKSENDTVAVVIRNGDIPVTILRFLLFVLQFKLYCFI